MRITSIRPYTLVKNMKITRFPVPSNVSQDSSTAFIHLDSSLDNTLKFFSGNLVLHRMFRSIAIDKKQDKRYTGISQINTAELFKQIKTTSHFINCTSNVDLLKNKNVIVPLYNEMKALLEKDHYLLGTKAKREEYLRDILINNINKLNNYNNINITINLNLLEYSKNNYDLSDYKELYNNLINVLEDLSKNISKYIKNYKKEILLILKDNTFNYGYIIPIYKYNQNDKDNSFDKTRFLQILNKINKIIKSKNTQELDIVDPVVIKNTDNIESISNELFVLAKNNSEGNDNIVVYPSLHLAKTAFTAKYNDILDNVIETDNIGYIKSLGLAKSIEDFSSQILHSIYQIYVDKKNTEMLKNFISLVKIENGILKVNGKLSIKENKYLLVDSKPIAIVDPITIEYRLSNYTGEEELINEKIDLYQEVILKKLKINTDAIPLNDEEQLILDSILNGVKDYIDNAVRSSEKVSKFTPAQIQELLIAATKEESISSKIKDLANQRVITSNEIKKKQLISALDQRQQTAKVVIDETEDTLSNVISKISARNLDINKFNINVLNKEMTQSSALSFRKSYDSSLMEQDFYNIFTSFKDSDDIPIFVDEIKITDTSNVSNKVNTLEVRFTMPNGKPQRMKIQVPKVSSDGYLFLNGAKKLIQNQVVSLPIIKVISNGEDVVRFSTNYNKTFISRSTGVVNPAIHGFLKAVKQLAKDGLLKGKSYEFRRGSSSEANSGTVNSLEYDSYAKELFRIQVNKTHVIFAKAGIDEELNKRNIDKFALSENKDLKPFFIIGFEDKDIIWSDVKGTIYKSTSTGEKLKSEGTYYYKDSILDLVADKFSEIEPELAKQFRPVVDKNQKYVYSMIRIVGIKIPLIFFLSYKYNLDKVLEAYNIDYKFVDSLDKVNTEEYNGIIEFADGFLVYNTSEISKSLLVSGLKVVDTKVYNFNDFQANGGAYLDFFAANGKPRMGKALSNFYSLFIDPITKEILNDYKIPSDVLGSFLYCNTLLDNPDYKRKNDMSSYRIRNNEMINALIYKIVASNIENFRRAGIGESSTASLTLPSNALIKELLESPIVVDVPILNPIREAEMVATTTYKGYGGSPFNHAKGTEEVRAYDESMRGIYGVTTPDNDKAGITRKLSMNTMIINQRGYLNVSQDTNLNATNLLTIGELISPFTATHADPPR